MNIYLHLQHIQHNTYMSTVKWIFFSFLFFFVDDLETVLRNILQYIFNLPRIYGKDSSIKIPPLKKKKRKRKKKPTNIKYVNVDFFSCLWFNFSPHARHVFDFMLSCVFSAAFMLRRILQIEFQMGFGLRFQLKLVF